MKQKMNNKNKMSNKHVLMFLAGAVIILLLFRMKPCGKTEGFSSASKDGKLVMFYADWCGHCKAVKPTFTALRSEHGGKYDMQDCSSPEEAKRYDVKSFPTFRYFPNPREPHTSANYETYTGGRTMDALSSFMKVQK